MKILSRPPTSDAQEEFDIDKVVDVISDCVMFEPKDMALTIIKTSLVTLKKLNKIFDFATYELNSGAVEVYVQLTPHQMMYTFVVS